MNVLLLEWLTSGGLGLGDGSNEFDDGMLAMGTAMVSAVAEDLAKFSRVDLVWDESLPEPEFDCRNSLEQRNGEIKLQRVVGRASAQKTVQRLAERADAIVVIAPETDGLLAQTIGSLGRCKRKLVSPTLEFTSLTSNKNVLAKQLKASGFPCVPNGVMFSAFLEYAADESPISFPVVVKPSDGAGSEKVSFVESRKQLLDLFSKFRESNELEDFRVEQFVEGVAVSVSVIGNPSCFSQVEFATDQVFGVPQGFGSNSSLVLKPLRQKFDRAPFGEYLNSVDDLSDEQISRAQNLVKRLVQHLPATGGYFGVDMILSVDGPGFDRVIEVNPRLTMSYLKLRKIHVGNLAFEMIKRASTR